MANQQVRRHLSEDEMNRGIGILEDSRSQRHVAHVIGVSKSVVSRMWNRFQMTGNVLQGHAGGRERSRLKPWTNLLSFRPDANVYWTTLRPYLTTSRMRVSTQTVRNRLDDARLRSWRSPSIRIPLTQRHIQERFQWAQTHVRWTVDWTPVLFTDESMCQCGQTARV
jgi:transposase